MTDELWAQIDAYKGDIRLGAATWQEIDRIRRRRARGLPIFADEIEAVCYDVAVAYDEALALEAEDKLVAERVSQWLASKGVIWVPEPA